MIVTNAFVTNTANSKNQQNKKIHAKVQELILNFQSLKSPEDREPRREQHIICLRKLQQNMQAEDDSEPEQGDPSESDNYVQVGTIPTTIVVNSEVQEEPIMQESMRPIRNQKCQISLELKYIFGFVLFLVILFIVVPAVVMGIKKVIKK